MRFAALLALLFLAAGNAFAHGGKPHAPPPEAQKAALPVAAGSVGAPHGWSAPCEEQPGHACGCGNLSLCGPAKKAALPSAHVWYPQSVSPAAAIPAADSAAPLRRDILHPPARAPPLGTQ